MRDGVRPWSLVGALAAAATVLAACHAADGLTIGSRVDGMATDGGRVKTSGECEAYCAKAQAKGCGTNCAAACGKRLSGTPTHCRSAMLEFYACAGATGEVTCKEKAASVAGCEEERRASEGCLESAALESVPDAAPPRAADAAIPVARDAGPEAAASGNVCNELRTDIPACDSCSATKCCQPKAACLGSPACLRLIDCLNACQSQQCFDTCARQNPDGDFLLSTLESCETIYCVRECGP